MRRLSSTPQEQPRCLNVKLLRTAGRLLLVATLLVAAGACATTQGMEAVPVKETGKIGKIVQKHFSSIELSQIAREAKEGEIIGGRRFLPHYNNNELKPSPIKGLPPAFQPGDYYIKRNPGPGSEGLLMKIYKVGKDKFELDIIDTIFEKVLTEGDGYKIETTSQEMTVDGKNIPLVGKIVLSSGITIEIVSYQYPYVAIITRNEEGEPWGQFFKVFPENKPKVPSKVKKDEAYKSPSGNKVQKQPVR